MSSRLERGEAAGALAAFLWGAAVYGLLYGPRVLLAIAAAAALDRALEEEPAPPEGVVIEAEVVRRG